MKKTILIGLAALFITAGQVAGSTTRYEFVEGQSTVLQTGGFAGVRITYSVTGHFVLTVDFQAAVASFDEVDATLSEIGLSHTQSLDELFNMTELVGTFVSDTEIHFVGKTKEAAPVDVNLMVTLADDSVEMTGGTQPPCCDFFVYDVNAVAFVAPEPGIIYVDDDAVGQNNGSSWTDAYNHLQDALADARASAPPVEIHVAQGTYKPDCGLWILRGDRSATFQLITGVAVKGGYAGFGQPDPNERNVQMYETILSGHIGTVPDTSDNSYHIVTGTDTDETAILDGFTVTAGNANGTGSDGDGAGMLNAYNSSPTVTNCTFSANSVARYGGAMRNKRSSPRLTNCTFHRNSADQGGGISNSDSSPMLTDCTFTENTAGSFGGGMCNFGSSPTLSNCTFSKNSSLAYACGMYNNRSSPTLTNCTFIQNSGFTLGGGMYNTNASKPRLTNCTFSWNSAYEGAGVENYSCSPILTNCTFNNNYSRNNGAGMFNYLSSNPTLTNCKFISNFAVEDGGGICNEHNSSPTLTNCMFIGNCAEWAGGMRNYGSPTLTNCIFFSNLANKDGGGFYTSSRNPTLKNCILWGNTDRGGTDESAQIFKDSGSLVVNYSCIQGWTGAFGGTGNISDNPCLADPNNGDYHLKSQAGRWEPSGQTWVQDDVTSPCIDTGNPMTPIGNEPFPNGGAINMGAYGGTAEASKSYFGEPLCETIVAGDINGDCKVDFKDVAIMGLHWLEDHNPPPP